MREIRTSGSMRGERAALFVSSVLLLYREKVWKLILCDEADQGLARNALLVDAMNFGSASRNQRGAGSLTNEHDCVRANCGATR